MAVRALGGALALLVAAGGVTDAVATSGSPTPAPQATRLQARVEAIHEIQPAIRSASTTSAPTKVWVGASVATVWVKPGRTRPVDAPALRARPDITQWINRQSLRQREDLGPRVMTQALHGDALVLLDRRTGWSKVRLPDQTGNKFPDGIVGWVPTRQLTTTRPAHRVLKSNTRPHGTGLDVLRIARGYLGDRYLWGGMTRAGLDCSGLTYRVFRSLGVVLPRDAADQSHVGTPVARRDLRKGDLVFFGTGLWPQIHHVGIYAGRGWVLHAPYTGTTVQLTKLHTWSDYWGARRIR